MAPTTYSANNSVRISWEVYNSSQTLNFPVMLRATNDLSGSGQANQQADLFPITTLNAGFSINNRNHTFFTTPSATGTYAINFETGVDVNLIPTIINSVAIPDSNNPTPTFPNELYEFNLFCSVEIDVPARAGGETAHLAVKWFDNLDQEVDLSTPGCDVNIPEGETYSTSLTPYSFNSGVNNIHPHVGEYCVSDSTANINTSSPSC